MRENTRIVSIGNRKLGGKNPILVQTMADIKTSRVGEILSMDADLKALGNDLLRLSVLDKDDAEAFGYLSARTDTPLIADVHFNYQYAISAMEHGAKGIRINPGNIGSEENIVKVLECARHYGVPIRIGVNSGSLPARYASAADAAESYVAALDEVVKIIERHRFHDLVLSLKSTDPEVTYRAYKLADSRYDYPLHIGVTEAGAGYVGALRSAVALVPLLKEGIGNTIRISLTEPPRDEVIACVQLLKAMGLRDNEPTLISCPTCGRTQVDLMRIYAQVARHLEKIHVNIKVAVMGCPVNGPGEARDADIGLAGGIGSFLVFEKGRPLRSMKEDEALRFLLAEIDRIAGQRK